MKRDMQDFSPPPAEYTALPPEVPPLPPEITPEDVTGPEAEKPKRRRLRFLLYAAAALVYLGLLYRPAGEEAPAPSAPPAPEPSAAVMLAPVSTPEPTPTPAPTPTPTPTPTPELTLEWVSGTYDLVGEGVLTGGYVYEHTDAETAPCSATVTITPGDDSVLVVDMILNGAEENKLVMEVPYTYDEKSGSASFIDSDGFSWTLIFTEVNDQITLEITVFRELSHGTETVTMTGAKTESEADLE